MLGQLFFKQGEDEGKENDLSLVDEDIETLPYEVLKTYEVKAKLNCGHFSPNYL